MRTGVVLEKSEKTAIILKSDGTFETVKARNEWKIGDLVQIKEIKKKNRLPIAACIVFCFLIGISSQMYFTKAMVISVDDKQSMEFNINRFGKIISVKGYNKESEVSMSNMQLKYKNYEEVLENIVIHNVEKEEQKDSTYMLITLQLDDKTKEQEIIKKIESITESYYKVNGNYQIDYMVVDNKTLDTAHSHGMTAGIYSKIKELADMDSSVKIEDFSHCNVNTINQEIESCHEQSEGHSHHHHHGNSGH